MSSGSEKPPGANPWSTWKPQLVPAAAPSAPPAAASRPVSPFGSTLRAVPPKATPTEGVAWRGNTGSSPGLRINVGIGELQVARGSGEIVTHGLGSCIAVLLWDSNLRVAGMLHLMLPDSNVDRGRATKQPALFADLGVPLLFDAFERQGGRLSGVRVSLFGGASIPGAPTLFDIGKRNLLAVRKVLWAKRLAVASEDVGGSVSRTVRLVIETGATALL